jgi:ribonuclease HI
MNTFNTHNTLNIEVFTDGSSLNNNKKNIQRFGGIGIFFGDDDDRNLSESLSTPIITNNIAELTACLKALEIIKQGGQGTSNKPTKITIYTDSKYVINSMTKWIKKWRTNGYQTAKKKAIENCDLIKKLDNIINDYKTDVNSVKIEFIYSPGHTKEPSDKNSFEYKLWYGNDKADGLAWSASMRSAGKSPIKSKRKQIPYLEL